MRAGVTYAGAVIYAREVINDGRRHLCGPAVTYAR
jgi:hypothetical protein